jgi:hypothetical protein
VISDLFKMPVAEEHADHRDDWWVLPTCKLRTLMMQAQAGEDIGLLMLSFYLECEHDHVSPDEPN